MEVRSQVRRVGTRRAKNVFDIYSSIQPIHTKFTYFAVRSLRSLNCSVKKRRDRTIYGKAPSTQRLSYFHSANNENAIELWGSKREQVS